MTVRTSARERDAGESTGASRRNVGELIRALIGDGVHFYV